MIQEGFEKNGRKLEEIYKEAENFYILMYRNKSFQSLSTIKWCIP